MCLHKFVINLHTIQLSWLYSDITGKMPESYIFIHAMLRSKIKLIIRTSLLQQIFRSSDQTKLILEVHKLPIIIVLLLDCISLVTCFFWWCSIVFFIFVFLHFRNLAQYLTWKLSLMNEALRWVVGMHVLVSLACSLEANSMLCIYLGQLTFSAPIFII
jgi:hypothetical protein